MQFRCLYKKRLTRSTFGQGAFGTGLFELIQRNTNYTNNMKFESLSKLRIEPTTIEPSPSNECWVYSSISPFRSELLSCVICFVGSMILSKSQTFEDCLFISSIFVCMSSLVASWKKISNWLGGIFNSAFTDTKFNRRKCKRNMARRRIATEPMDISSTIPASSICSHRQRLKKHLRMVVLKSIMWFHFVYSHFPIKMIFLKISLDSAVRW